MNHLQEQLQNLRSSLLEMSELVVSQFGKCITSLNEQDDDLANEVIHNEKRVNAFELKIDRECEKIFALLTPVAKDMRFVFGSLKINADLERIADYAEGIAELILLSEKKFDPLLVEQIELSRMFDVAFEMLRDVGEAYANDDTRLARSVFARDKELNRINGQVTAIVEDYIKGNTSQIKQSLLLMSMIRKLERVGDHITNIAEEVIFYKEAKILKHGNKGGVEHE